MHFNSGSRIEVLKRMGVSINKDESTNNQSEFYWYCRDSISSKMFSRHYVFWFIWAFIGGYASYKIAFSTLNGIIMEDG